MRRVNSGRPDRRSRAADLDTHAHRAGLYRWRELRLPDVSVLRAQQYAEHGVAGLKQLDRFDRSHLASEPDAIVYRAVYLRTVHWGAAAVFERKVHHRVAVALVVSKKPRLRGRA